MGADQAGRVDEEVRRRFEAAWLTGEPEPIAHFLAADTSSATLLELCHIELEFCWQRQVGAPPAGTSPPLVEDYLTRFGQLAEDDETVLELLTNEYYSRSRYGEGAPEPAEYRRRFPRLADRLGGVDALWQSFLNAQTRPPSTERSVVGELFVDRYLLVEELGRGGMGVVYRAQDRLLEREVALKLIVASASDEEAHRFVREAAAMARLNHPNVIRIFDVGTEQGRPYFTMELSEGETLAEILRRMRVVPVEAAARIARRLAMALAAVHQAGLVHRDVKPSNVLIEAVGGPVVGDGTAASTTRLTLADGSAASYRVLLSDFGLVHDASAHSLTRSDQFLGTPLYMSPEQARGDSQATRQPTTDVYSLGAVLFEMVSGRPPHMEPQLVPLLAAIQAEDPPSLRKLVKGLPRDLETIVRAALEKEPARRYPNCSKLAEDLRRFLEGEPITATRPGLAYRLWKKALKHRVPVAAGMLVAVTLLAILGWYLTRPGYLRLEGLLPTSRVWVNDVEYPAERFHDGRDLAVRAGPIRLVVEAPHREPVELELLVERLERVTRTITLRYQTGQLAWSSSVAGAIVTLRHLESGQVLKLGTPFSNVDVPVGRYQCRVEADRHHPLLDESLEVRPGPNRQFTYLAPAVLWDHLVGYSPDQGLQPADVEGDGQLELLAASESSYTAVFDLESGKERWRAYLATMRRGTRWVQADGTGPLETISVTLDGEVVVRDGLTGKRRSDLEGRLPIDQLRWVGWQPLEDRTGNMIGLIHWDHRAEQLAILPWPLGGPPRWEMSTPVRRVDQLAPGGDLIEVQADGLVRRSWTDGRSAWTRPFERPHLRWIGPPADDGRQPLVVQLPEELVGVDAAGGTILWRHPLRFSGRASAVDMTGDGRPELALLAWPPANTVTFVDPLEGTISTVELADLGPRPATPVTSVVPTSGEPEVWLGTAQQIWRLSLDGAPPRRLFAIPGTIPGLCIDANRDGLMDLVLFDPSGQISCLTQPKAHWEQDFTAIIRTRPAIGDMDGDGTREIFCISLEGDAGLFDLERGTPIRTWDFRGYQAGHYGSDPLLCDLDGDGRDEVVMGRWLSEGGAVALSLKGDDFRWEAVEVGPVQAPPAELPTGHGSDVLFATWDGAVHRIDGRTGQSLWRCELRMGSNARPLVWPSVGQPELVLVLTLDGALHACSPNDGKLEWTVPAVPKEAGDIRVAGRATPLMADADGDGFDDLIFPLLVAPGSGLANLRCYSPRKRLELWARTMTSSSATTPGRYLTSDGQSALLYAGSSRLEALRLSDGQPLWRFDHGDVVSATPQVADVNGDGRRELVFVSRLSDRVQPAGHLWIYDLERLEPRWRLRLEGWCEKAPWIVDLADGTAIVLAARDRRLRAVSGAGRKWDGWFDNQISLEPITPLRGYRRGSPAGE